MKKKVSIAIPCYNEAQNIPLMYDTLIKMFENELKIYDYEILFVDNKSQDNSRDILRELCSKNKKVKAIFNLINCGPNTNGFYALRESEADCTILMDADFQEPPEMIPIMLKAWEEGNKVVCMIKNKSDENKLVYYCREIYYRVFLKMSSIKQIRQFTGFGCYDRSFVEILRKIKDPIPFTKGIIAEFAPERKEISFTQHRRKNGKSSLDFLGYYDSAMLSFTTYTKNGLRIATFFGLLVSVMSFVLGLVYFLLKLLYWDEFTTGTIPILLCVLFFGGFQLFFTGLLGEYILNINTRVIDRPMVVEEERINFGDSNNTKKGMNI